MAADCYFFLQSVAVLPVGALSTMRYAVTRPSPLRVTDHVTDQLLPLYAIGGFLCRSKSRLSASAISACFSVISAGSSPGSGEALTARAPQLLIAVRNASLSVDLYIHKFMKSCSLRNS